MKLLFVVNILTLLLVHSSIAQWTQTSGPYGAHVTSVALTTTYQFVGTSNGVYRGDVSSPMWHSGSLMGSRIGTLLANDTMIFAGTDKGLYSSIDSGASWDTTGLMNRIAVSLAKRGSTIFAGTVNGLFASSNAGSDWNQIDSGLTSKHVNVLLSGPEIVLAATLYDGLYKSTNDGAVWTRTNFPDNAIFALAFIGTDILASSWDNAVYRSTDSGSTWTAFEIGDINTVVVSFASNNQAVFAGANNGLFTSPDSGRTWLPFALDGTYVNDMELNGSHFLAGSFLGVYQSTDLGATWDQANTGLISSDVNALASSGSTLFAGTQGFGIHVSADNGATWAPFGAGQTHPNIDGLAVNGSDLFAGTHGGVYRSNTAAPSWNNLTSGFAATGSRSFIFNGSTILASSYDGVIRSTNYGNTWDRIDSIHISNSNYQTWGVLDIGSAIIAGYNQKGIRISTDNGTTWNYSNDGISSITVDALAKLGPNIVIGTSGIGVFVSSNNGVTWFQSGLTTSQVRSFHTIGHSIFAGGGGGVYRSHDYGLTWMNLSEGLPYYVHSLASSGGFLFAGTMNGAVWRRPLAEITSIPTEQMSLSSFDLFQNFPNPFNSETTIRYQLLRDGVARLRVYDAVGRLVKTLLNKYQMSGSFQVTFNASNLPSGVYFYRLESGTYSVTKALLLLK